MEVNPQCGFAGVPWVGNLKQDVEDCRHPRKSPRPPALFIERIGFKAYCEKRYYPVELRKTSSSRKTGHLPEVTKLLLQKYYFVDGKDPGSAAVYRKRGDIFPDY
jgi:hypothetical protein